MQTKSNIQLIVERQDYCNACYNSLANLLENYKVNGPIFTFDSRGGLVEVTEGYATVQKETTDLHETVKEALDNGQGIRVLEGKFQLVNLHKSIAECEEGFKTLEIVGVEA